MLPGKRNPVSSCPSPETITGVTVPTASAEMLLNYRGTMIRAARTQDVGIMGVELNEIWKRIKIHGISLA